MQVGDELSGFTAGPADGPADDCSGRDEEQHENQADAEDLFLMSEFVGMFSDSAPDQRQPQHEKDGDDRADDSEERNRPVAVRQIVGGNKRHDGEREPQAEGQRGKDSIGRLIG